MVSSLSQQKAFGATQFIVSNEPSSFIESKVSKSVI